MKKANVGVFTYEEVIIRVAYVSTASVCRNSDDTLLYAYLFI